MINEERGYMTKINNMIPEGARYIMHTFARYGYLSYLVGGCVRDIILGRTPHDWDICTKATPEQMELMVYCMIQRENDIEQYEKDCGRVYVKRHIKTIPTGLKHGTLTIIINNESYEVTTFRCDGNYSDGRRPDNVLFTNSLVDDLQRRDFTINAIAYSMWEGFIDPFNGMKDIEDKVIRCVGNPRHRFTEDGLRIMRAIRFSAQLNFDIEDNTNKAIIDLIENLYNVSEERINSEMCKILKSSYPERIMEQHMLCQIIPEFKPSISFEQNNPHHIYTVFEHILYALHYDKSNDLIVRLALLFHDISKPYCYQDDEDGIRHFKGHGKLSADMTYTIMRRLKFDNDTIEKVVELVYYHDATFEFGKKYVKRWLNKMGEEQFNRLLKVRIADIKAQSCIGMIDRVGKICEIQRLLNEVLNEKECFSLKDLQINGKDLIELGVPEGKQIGSKLNYLLSMVMDGKIKNEREELIRATIEL